MMQHSFFNSLPTSPQDLHNCTPPQLCTGGTEDNGAKNPLLATRQNSRRLTASFIAGGTELIDVTTITDTASKIKETECEAGAPWIRSSHAADEHTTSAVSTSQLDEVPESEEEDDLYRD